jgi:hypothetical protein
VGGAGRRLGFARAFVRAFIRAFPRQRRVGPNGPVAAVIRSLLAGLLQAALEAPVKAAIQAWAFAGVRPIGNALWAGAQQRG